MQLTLDCTLQSARHTLTHLSQVSLSLSLSAWVQQKKLHFIGPAEII